MELTWEKKQELIKSFYLKKGLKQKYLIMVLEALNLNFSTFVALAHNGCRFTQFNLKHK